MGAVMQALPTRLATGSIPEVPVEWVAAGEACSGYPSKSRRCPLGTYHSTDSTA